MSDETTAKQPRASKAKVSKDLQLKTEEAERAVLGSILINEEALHRVTPILRDPNMFGVIAHRHIYRMLLDLSARNVPIDSVTVLSALNSIPCHVAPSDIAALTRAPTTTANVAHYAEIVRDGALLRAVSETCQRYLRTLPDLSGEEALESIISDLNDVGMGMDRESSMREAMKYHREWLATGHIHAQGLETGIKTIDNAIPHGIQPYHIVIIAARPKEGKSAMLMTWAYNMTQDPEVHGLLFSLEMDKAALLRRLNAIACLTSEYLLAIRPSAFPMERPRLMEKALHKIEHDRLEILDGYYTIDRLCATVRQRVLKNPKIKFVMIDYLQILGTSKRVGDDRETIDYCLTQLRRLKDHVKRPIIIAAQLRRKYGEYEKESGHPTMDDLKGSGRIEQDADIIVLMKGKDIKDEMEFGVDKDNNRNVLISLVQREGANKDFEVRYVCPQTKFMDWKH